MNPWLFFLLIMAAAVYGIDYLVRRKKWKDNTKTEKISLLVHMLSAGFYIFLSALGLLWVLSAGTPETAFGEVVYDVTLTMGSCYFFVAIAAVIGSFILRKKEKLKASIWINIIALIYIVVVLTVNYLAGTMM